ncbi:MAG: replication-relaxation family protein, partial [Pirellulales bacterium]
RDIAILRALVRYFVLSRPQIQRLHFPEDGNGRSTRRRLQLLVDLHLINRQHLLYAHPTGGAPASVYYPSRQGCELLFEEDGDEHVLLTPTAAPIPHHINHWLAISETHIALDAAIHRQATVAVDGWINEWDICNKDETVPDKRFRLYSLLCDQPKLVCAPDAAFLLSMEGHKKVFYLEQDRHTSGVIQVASSKTKGYAVLAELALHRRHFPQATVPSFTVLLIAPSPKRRDALRHAMKDKPASQLWRFASATDLTPEAFLHSPIIFPCEGEPGPLVRRAALPPAS